MVSEVKSALTTENPEGEKIISGNPKTIPPNGSRVENVCKSGENISLAAASSEAYGKRVASVGDPNHCPSVEKKTLVKTGRADPSKAVYYGHVRLLMVVRSKNSSL